MMSAVYGEGYELMRKILIAAGLLLALCTTAFAQSNSPVILPSGCGTGNFASGEGYLTIDSAGRLCNSSITGGGVTPSAPSGALTLTTGGTAQNLFSAGEVVHGCTIQNPASATEPISVNFFTASSSATAGGTTSISVPAGSSIPCGVGLTTAVSWVAATTGHAINAVKF
jgi:hypothetical protein